MFVARSLVHIKINPKSKITGVSARGFSQDKKSSRWGMGKQSGTSTPQGGAPQQPPKTTASSVDSPGKAQASQQTSGSSGRQGSIEIPKLFSKTEESKYALALLSSANKNNALDQVARDAKLIVSSSQGGALAAVGRIFTDRALTTKDRLRKAAPILKNFNPLTQRVVRVLINDMNGVLVPTVMENYLNLLKEARKEFTAVVSTAKPITPEERQKYIQIAKEKMNRGPDTIIHLVERIDDRLESGFTISLPNLYVNKGRVKDEGKKEKKKAAILTGLSTTAIKDMEGPKISYEQWLTKMRENLTDDLVKQLNVD